MGLFRMAHYTEHLSTSPLESGPIWPWYSSTYINSATPLAPLGAYWELAGDLAAGGGNAFMYVKAAAGVSFAQGQVVSFATPAASTVAAGSTTLKVVWAAGGLTAGAEVGNLLYVANSTALGGGFTIKRIKSNTTTDLVISETDPNIASKPSDPDAFAVAPTTGDVAVIIRPFQVIVCTGTLTPCGVALGTVTAGYYTIIQVSGLGLALGVGTGTALAVNVPAICGASGELLGSTAGATPYMGGACFLPQAAYSSTSALQPFLFSCRANI